MSGRVTQILIGIAALFFVYLLYTSMHLSGTRVEVCMTFRGKTQCRAARGLARPEAVRTATEAACATLSSGMTESIACANTRPDSIKDLPAQ